MLTLWLIPRMNRDLAYKLLNDSRCEGRAVHRSGVFLCAASSLFLVPSILLGFELESGYTLLMPIAVGLIGFSMLRGWRVNWLWVPLCIPVLVFFGFIGDIFIAAALAAVLTPVGAVIAHLCFLGFGVYCVVAAEGTTTAGPDGDVRSAGTLRAFDLPEGHP
jgi:hypothetical protein